MSGGGMSLTVRVIEYHVTFDGETTPELFCLVTDLIDHQTHPAHLLAAAYRWRWDGCETHEGVLIRVLQRLLALTAAIWHNDHTDQPIKRSLIAYDRLRPLKNPWNRSSSVVIAGRGRP